MKRVDLDGLVERYLSTVPVASLRGKNQCDETNYTSVWAAFTVPSDLGSKPTETHFAVSSKGKTTDLRSETDFQQECHPRRMWCCKARTGKAIIVPQTPCPERVPWRRSPCQGPNGSFPFNIFCMEAGPSRAPSYPRKYVKRHIPRRILACEHVVALQGAMGSYICETCRPPAYIGK